MANQEQIIISFLAKDTKPKSIGDVHAGTGILRPNIRRILGQGEKKGKFIRIGTGVYTNKTADGKVTAYAECAEAEKALPELVKQGIKFDMVVLDSPYFSRALVGGNRGIKEYSFISPETLRLITDNVFKLLRTDQSHVYVMLSGATTAQNDMEKYVAAVTDTGLKLVIEGTYTKTFSSGKQVTNVRGETAKPERLLLFTVSGKISEPVEMDFTFQRPNGYQTEKAQGLLRTIIEQSTKVGDFVLDTFGGSGVAAEQSILCGRSVYIIEKTLHVVTDLIIPRVNRAINSYNFLNS